MKRPSIIAIAMDAERGEILASVVHPGRGKYRRVSRNNAATDRDNDRPRLPVNRDAWGKYGLRGFFSKIKNRAVTDAFEPGNDIMNLFINAAALEEKVINKNDVAVATTTPEGVLTRLGEDRLYDYLRKFGFGRKTGVALSGESNGIVNKPGCCPADSRGPGYCMAATPIQLLSAFCAIANDGILMVPHVVSKTVSSDNKVFSAYPPHVRARPLSGETASALLSMITKQSSVDGCDGIIPMISGTAARFESHYAPGEITLFTLAFLGGRHKTGVLLIVDNPSNVDQAKKFSEDVMRSIAGYYGRDALHASETSEPPEPSEPSGSIARYQVETKDFDTGIIIPEPESAPPTPPQDAKPDDAGKNNENITKPNARKHKVQEGDSLYKLAIQYYNDGTKWTVIRDANAEIIKKRNDLKIGQTLIIPDL